MWRTIRDVIPNKRRCSQIEPRLKVKIERKIKNTKGFGHKL